MRAEPLARRTLTTLEAKAGASSGSNAFSSPGEIKRWPITTPGKERASIADWSEGSTVIIILGRDYRFRGSCAFGRQRTRNTRLNNSSCTQRRAWRCGDTIPGARQLMLILRPRRLPAARCASITANDFAHCQSCRDDPAGPIDHATRRNGRNGEVNGFPRWTAFCWKQSGLCRSDGSARPLSARKIRRS